MFRKGVILLLLSVVCLPFGCSDDAGSGPSDGVDSGVDIGFDVAPDSADIVDDVVPRGCESDYGRVTIEDVALDEDGLSEPIQFDIPECAHSFIAMVQGDTDVYFILQRLTAPSGADWVTDVLSEPLDPIMELFLGPFPGQFLSPIRMVQAEGVASALVPNSPAVVLESGTYEAVVQGGRISANSAGQATISPYQGTVSVTIVWKNPDTMPVGATLDVTVHLTGAGDITSANAEDSALLQGALDRLAEIYGAAGISIGEVRYVDIDSRYRTIRSIEGANNDLSAMFTLSGGSPPGMNYFLVDRFDIEGVPGGAIGGVAGGIPGPALKPGSPRSGVAVSVAAAGGDSAILAHVMAHEGGHYLGLFHVQEFFGAEDPLDDTPTGRGAENNLMYPTVGGDTTITEQQRRVLHNHPEVAP